MCFCWKIPVARGVVPWCLAPSLTSSLRPLPHSLSNLHNSLPFTTNLLPASTFIKECFFLQIPFVSFIFFHSGPLFREISRWSCLLSTGASEQQQPQQLLIWLLAKGETSQVSYPLFKTVDSSISSPTINSLWFNSSPYANFEVRDRELTVNHAHSSSPPSHPPSSHISTLTHHLTDIVTHPPPLTFILPITALNRNNEHHSSDALLASLLLNLFVAFSWVILNQILDGISDDYGHGFLQSGRKVRSSGKISHLHDDLPEDTRSPNKLTIWKISLLLPQLRANHVRLDIFSGRIKIQNSEGVFQVPQNQREHHPIQEVHVNMASLSSWGIHLGFEWVPRCFPLSGMDSIPTSNLSNIEYFDMPGPLLSRPLLRVSARRGAQ